MDHAFLDFGRALFLEGPPGAGKTTSAITFVNQLVESGVERESILVLLPSASPALPYSMDRSAVWRQFGIPVTDFYMFLHTARNLLAEIISHSSSLGSSTVFTSREQSMFRMAQLAAPLLEVGHLRGIRLSTDHLVRRIYQLYETAALSRLTLAELDTRLTSHPEQQSPLIRDNYRTLSQIFHLYHDDCISHHRLDHALLAGLFISQLVDADTFATFFRETFGYLVVDNVEEMSATEHDFVFWAMENVGQTLIVYDSAGGYSPSADAAKAQQFRKICDTRLFWPAQPDSPMSTSWRSEMGQTTKVTGTEQTSTVFWQKRLFRSPFYANMVTVCSEKVADLLRETTATIAIILPFLTTALEAVFRRSLESRGTVAFVHNPPYPLSDDPFIQAVITLLMDYPDPEYFPVVKPERMAHALQTLIDGLDPIRARLLVEIAYRKGKLNKVEMLPGNLSDRISDTLRERYNRLWEAVETAQQSSEDTSLDLLIERFGAEVLMQPGYLAHSNEHQQWLLSILIQKARDFRESFYLDTPFNWLIFNREFRAFLQSKFPTSDPLSGQSQAATTRVIITTPGDYLTAGLVCDYQFWVDIANSAWRHDADQLFWSSRVLRTHDAPEHAAPIAESTAQAIELLRRCKQEFYLLESQRSVNGREYNQTGVTQFFNMLSEGLEKNPIS